MTEDTQADALFDALDKFITKYKARTGEMDIYLHTDNDPSGYLSGSPFVLTFEGGEFYYAMNNHVMAGWLKKDYTSRAKWVKQLHKIIEKHGYYAAMGTSWAMGFFKR